jgi:chemotaxis protein methyltransferase CheR
LNSGAAASFSLVPPAFSLEQLMDSVVFQRFCAHAHQQAGIALGPSKEALVAARVGKRMRALGIDDERTYLDYLEADRTGGELIQFLDVISTNHTSFFREPDHFDSLRTMLHDWHQSGLRHLRIWSAAASTGEEPYSIVMTVLDVLQDPGIDFKLLATDISTRVLARAQQAVYPVESLTAIPRPFLARFFQRTDGTPQMYRVHEEVKRHVVFRRLNLSQPPFPMRGPLDIVFCRNVLIYFDLPVRQRLLETIQGLLRPGGWLFLGHTETLTGITTAFRVVRPSVFFLPDDRKAGGA